MVITKESWVVDGALAIVLWMSRLYGIVPLSFQFTRTSTIVTCISRPIYLIGVLFISLINLIAIALLVYDPEAIEGAYPNPEASKNKNRLLGTVNILISIATTLYCSITSVSKMKRYMHFTSEINKIKNSLDYRAYTSGPKLWHAICLITLFMFELLVLPLLPLMDLSNYDGFLITIIWVFANFTLYGALGMMVLHFVFVALHVKSSFEVINKCLADVLTEISQESKAKLASKNAINFKIPINSINKAIDLLGNMNQDLKMTPRMKLARKIRAISSGFAQTCEVMRDLNNTENVYLLVHVVIITMYLVITINNLVEASYSTSDQKYMKIPSECVWFVYHTFRIVLIVEPCHRIQEELSQTKTLVAHIMCEVMYEADPIFDATDNFFKQLHLNDVSITVMGMFSLGRSTISTIIGGATTLYIVLLEL